MIEPSRCACRFRSASAEGGSSCWRRTVATVIAGSVCRRIDNAMVKAIARAFRWRDMLESGEYATIREIANAEKINETYVGRVLRLTLLAPDIVEAILNGRQPTQLQLDGLMRRFPVVWNEQRAK